MTNMSTVFNRACALFVVVGGLAIGACGTPSEPTAQPSALDVSSGLPALAQGVTDATLMNAGWSCVAPPIPFPFIICAPPGLGFPPFPPLPDNGGAPSYTLMIFTRDHQLDHHAKFLRPDLYQGQPCLGGDPWQLFPLVNYYHCIIPVR